METVCFEIKEIKVSDDGKKSFIYDMEGNMHIGWTNKVKDYVAGNTMAAGGEWKTSQKGNAYFEIKTVGTEFEGEAIPGNETKPKAEPPKKAPAQQEKIFKVDPDKTNSIEAQVAFKGLVELEIAGKLDPKIKTLAIEWAVSKLGYAVKE